MMSSHRGSMDAYCFCEIAKLCFPNLIHLKVCKLDFHSHFSVTNRWGHSLVIFKICLMINCATFFSFPPNHTRVCVMWRASNSDSFFIIPLGNLFSLPLTRKKNIRNRNKIYICWICTINEYFPQRTAINHSYGWSGGRDLTEITCAYLNPAKLWCDIHSGLSNCVQMQKLKKRSGVSFSY